MRRYLEYGILSAALLTIIYIGIVVFTGLTINLIAIFLCTCGGLVTGLVIWLLLILFSPGQHIKEGDEDNYINK